MGHKKDPHKSTSLVLVVTSHYRWFGKRTQATRTIIIITTLTKKDILPLEEA